MSIYNLHNFIKNAQKLHTDFYNYSLVKYKNAHTKVSIICPVHGKFSQEPRSHITGSGCLLCKHSKLSKIFTKSQSKFIGQSIVTHVGKYTYQDTIYINDRKKVEITCHTHGNFWQTPSNHLRGHGCPKCKSSQGERRVMMVLDTLNINYKCQVKLKDCKNIRPLPFDFGLYDFKQNLLCLIEYQGKQHFPINDYFGKDVSFQKPLLENDNIKRLYCYNNKIPFLEISYLQINDIESVIKEFLMTNSIAL